MIPKVAAKGTSFKGAGLYYLHDKEADTQERVAFTHTENLPTNNPDMALKIMAHTAMHQEQLKTASGAPATGRKLTKPVYSYSLSWSPDQAPTQEQMINAAKETLTVLGLEGHETLMVGHSDTQHPHIHVIVNRVHPETGLAATVSKDHLKLSKWAEDYERRHGQILCEQRVENNRKRAEGHFVKYDRTVDIAAFHSWRKARLKSAFSQRQSEKDALAAAHAGQRQALFHQKETRILAARQAIKEQYRPQWATLFSAQDTEKRALQTSLATRRAKLLSSPESRSLRLLSLENTHERQRKKLSNETAQETKKAIAVINKTYKTDLRHLQNAQRHETQALAENHSRQSQNLARAIAENSDITLYRGAPKPATSRRESSGPATPPVPSMAPRLPVGPGHEARKKNALAQQAQQRLARRLQALKVENRPRWAALFKAQRDELKTLLTAQQAALPRVIYHLKHGPARKKNPILATARALIGTKDDLRALQISHMKARKALAREIGTQRRTIEKQAETDYQRDLTRLEKDLAREAAAYQKAVQEGNTTARAPDPAAPGVTATPEDFARQMRALIEQAKRHAEEERRRRGRDDGGRGRGE